MIFAFVRSWAWHLCYGMWRGYRETRTSDHRGLCALTSTDSDYRIVKVFWEREDGIADKALRPMADVHSQNS